MYKLDIEDYYLPDQFPNTINFKALILIGLRFRLLTLKEGAYHAPSRKLKINNSFDIKHLNLGETKDYSNIK